MSVSVRGANTLKLTFLSMKDVTEFGAIEEATPLFVPPGAKIIDATARTGESGKGYYQWDFEYGAARVLLTAAVEQGNCYLLGATAASERWDASEAGFRRAAASFRVGRRRRRGRRASCVGQGEGTARRGGEAGRRVGGRETEAARHLGLQGAAADPVLRGGLSQDTLSSHVNLHQVPSPYSDPPRHSSSSSA